MNYFTLVSYDKAYTYFICFKQKGQKIVDMFIYIYGAFGYPPTVTFG